jgi:hypothetical protein
MLRRGGRSLSNASGSPIIFAHCDFSVPALI